MEQSRIIQEFKKQKSHTETHYVYYSIFRVCVHRKSHLKSSIKKRKLSACTSALAVLSFISIQYFIKFWLRLPVFSVLSLPLLLLLLSVRSIDCICWFVYFTISFAQDRLNSALCSIMACTHIGSITEANVRLKRKYLLRLQICNQFI